MDWPKCYQPYLGPESSWVKCYLDTLLYPPKHDDNIHIDDNGNITIQFVPEAIKSYPRIKSNVRVY